MFNIKPCIRRCHGRLPFHSSDRRQLPILLDIIFLTQCGSLTGMAGNVHCLAPPLRQLTTLIRVCGASREAREMWKLARFAAAEAISGAPVAAAGLEAASTQLQRTWHEGAERRAASRPSCSGQAHTLRRGRGSALLQLTTPAAGSWQQEQHGMLMLHAGPGVRHLSQAAGARRIRGNWKAIDRR